MMKRLPFPVHILRGTSLWSNRMEDIIEKSDWKEENIIHLKNKINMKKNQIHNTGENN